MLIVATAILLAAGFAWYMKGDLEMGWLVVWPLIVGVTVLVAGVGSFLLPPGFPRAAVVLTAAPFGVLLAWLAATTLNSWRIPPAADHLAVARRIASDTVRLTDVARGALGAPVEIAEASVDSSDGAWRKVGGRLTLERREPRVRLTVTFAVGPRAPLRFEVTPGGELHVIQPLPDPAESVIRAEAITRRYPDVPHVEVGGQGPYAPGAPVPLRLMRAEDDWSIEIVRVLADGQPLEPRRTYSRAEIVAGLEAVLRSAGLQADRLVAYFRPAGARVTFFQAPAFEFIAPLLPRGTAGLRAVLDGDSLVFELGDVYR